MRQKVTGHSGDAGGDERSKRKEHVQILTVTMETKVNKCFFRSDLIIPGKF